jgi:hypothetical protein
MRNRFWLRGLAVSLGFTSLSGLFSEQVLGQYGQQLAPSAYPAQSPITFGGYPTYPSLAQNSQPGSSHVHVPQGNYTTAETIVPSHVPNASPTPAQPSYQVAPSTQSLPPIHASAPTYSQPTPASPSVTPMYSVPSPVPSVQPIPSQAYISAHPAQSPAPIAMDGSCPSCMTQAAPTYMTSAPASCGPVYAAPVAVAPNPWFFGAGALILNREDTDYVRLSSTVTPGTPAIPGPASLTTLDARMRTSGGFQAFGGRYFGCGRYAVMGSYWGLYPTEQSVMRIDSTPGVGVGDYFRTDLPLTIDNPGGTNEHGIEMPTIGTALGPDGGRTGYDWMTNSVSQRLVRSQDFNNFEINFFTFGLAGAARNGYANAGCGAGLGHGGGWHNGIYGRGGCGCGGHGCAACMGGCGSSCNSCGLGGGCGSCLSRCSGPTSACGPITGAQCSRLRMSWLGGLRWFRFNDYLEYAASDNDAIYGNGDDFYYRNTLRNDLLGFQLGGLANYCCGCRVNLYASSKAGIFGNRVTFDSFAGTDSETAIISSYNSSYDNQDYQSTKTGLAFLGEVEAGVGIRLTPGITGTCGYRVVGISGVATAPGQIPNDFSDFNAVRRIQDDGSVLLHGLSIGGMYNW